MIVPSRGRPFSRSAVRLVVVCAAVVGALPPSTAYANAGLPMVAIFLPPMWLALMPIIVVEAYVIARGAGCSFRSMIAGVAVANVVSTVVGIPVLWVLLASFEVTIGTIWSPSAEPSILGKLLMLVVVAPWLGPNVDQTPWLVPVALAILAVPFFLLSVLTEVPVIRRIGRVGPTPNFTRVVVIANLLSYLGLGLAMTIILSFGWSAGLWANWFFEPVVHWLAGVIFSLAAWFPGQG